VVRVPLLRKSGSARLRADAGLATVRADFESATPPVPAFQWGIADAVRQTAHGGTYDLSDLFGLGSVIVTTGHRSLVGAGESGGGSLELAVRTGGSPWATYTVSIAEQNGGSVVDVEWTSDRRFGLRRLPQWWVAERDHTEALVAQGYTVEAREASLSL